MFNRDKLKMYIFFSLRILVALLLLLFIFKKIPLKDIYYKITNANLKFLALSFLFFITIHLLCVKRWEVFIKGTGTHTGFLHLLFPFFSGLFFNLFFPSTLAGDFFRTVVLFEKNRSSSKIFASVILDRFSGFLALSIICIFSFILVPQLLMDRRILFIVMGFCIAVVVSLISIQHPYLFNIVKVIVPQHFKQKVERLKEAFIFFKNRPRIFWKSLVYSLLVQIGGVISMYFLLKSFYSDVIFIKISGFVVIINLISLLPVTIAGLGLRDLSSIYFLSLAGIPKEASLSASLITFSFFSVIGLIGGLVYVAFYTRWLQYNKFLASLQRKNT